MQHGEPVSVSMRLCVLASGSGGNASVVEFRREDGSRHVSLIDAGLSPRRLQQSLHGVGISLSEVRDAYITHFDRDHFHAGWSGRRMPFRVRVHEHHAGWARQAGVSTHDLEPFDGPFHPAPGVRVSSSLESHDQTGVSALRFDLSGGCSMGFATDLGCVTSDLVDLLHGVALLAIESNYCPVMQECSSRPAFLKQRIMGAAGHLSNEQSARAAALIEPLEHAVLLHLSRECNTPELARRAHDGGGYAITISAQDRATAWISPRSPMHISQGAMTTRASACDSGRSHART